MSGRYCTEEANHARCGHLIGSLLILIYVVWGALNLRVERERVRSDRPRGSCARVLPAFSDLGGEARQSWRSFVLSAKDAVTSWELAHPRPSRRRTDQDGCCCTTFAARGAISVRALRTVSGG